MADSGTTVTINGRDFDVLELTLDEQEEIEEALGKPWDEINWSSAKFMKQFAFTLLRRDDPALTLADIGKLTMRQFAGENVSNGNGATEADGDRPPA